MSGLEVIGGISAVIEIIDASAKVWDRARKDLKLSATFDTVANRLAILRDTLQTCHEHLEPVQNTLPADAADSLSKIVNNCKSKAEKLHTIFNETISGSKAAELIRSIAEDTQNLVNYHIVKSVTPELSNKLEQIIKEMESVEPSIPGDDITLQTLNAYDGLQNISTGSSTQYNSFNTGRGTTHNYGGITGNPFFNFGPIISGRTNFAGSYAHSSLHPVSTYVLRLGLERQLQGRLPIWEDPGRIKETRTVVVWGLGGVGKSQLVLNHIHKYRQQYRTLFWVEAGQKQTLERDFIQIHKLLFQNIAQSDRAIPIEDVVTAVKSWFHGQEGRSLWVMDSADMIDDEEDPLYIDLNYYLPDAPGVDIIITTRSSRARSVSVLEAVTVAEMTEDEAVSLFRSCAKLHNATTETEQQILTIVQELGCLALAVTLAGSYVNETPWLLSDLQQYLEEYRVQRKQTLSQKARPHEHRYRDSVLSTWEMSFTAVERRSPIAARLLNLVAFLNYDDIFLDLFAIVRAPYEAKSNFSHPQGVGLRGNISRACGRREEPLRTNTKSSGQENVRWIQLLSSEGTTVSHNTIKSGFKILQAYSLVSWRADQKAYAMHKLVHAWSHDRLDREQRQAWSLAVTGFLSELIAGTEKNLSWQTRMVPHVVANFSAMSAACGPPYPLVDRDRDALSTLGGLLCRLGRWDDEYEVRLFLKQAATVALGKEHPFALGSMISLASVLTQQGKHEQAEEMLRQPLELIKKVLGPEHPDTLTSINNLAFVLYERGEHEQAEKMYRQTLELMKKVLGPEHPNTLTSMNNLALVLSKQGKNEQVEEMHRQTLMLRTKVLGPKHPGTLTSMGNLATALYRQGKHEQAEEMQRQTLELMKKVLGSEHPDILSSMNNLALVLGQQGKYEQAEEMHRQTLETMKKMLGPEHPGALTSMGNLAVVLYQQGKHEQAEEVHRQTLELKKKALGLEHPNTLTSMNYLAMVLSRQDKDEQAEQIHRQVLELKEKVLGPEHPSTLTSMSNLALVLSKQGKYEQAEETHRQVLKLREKVLGPEHPSTLTSMGNLAGVLRQQDRDEQAEEIRQGSLQIRWRIY